MIAPVKISAHANVAAGSVITKDVPANALAVARGHQVIIDNWVTKKLNEQTNNVISKS